MYIFHFQQLVEMFPAHSYHVPLEQEQKILSFGDTGEVFENIKISPLSFLLP